MSAIAGHFVDHTESGFPVLVSSPVFPSPGKNVGWLSSAYVEAGRRRMNTVKNKIRDAATLILVARNKALSSHFDYRVLLLERGEKSTFMVSRLRLIFG